MHEVRGRVCKLCSFLFDFLIKLFLEKTISMPALMILNHFRVPHSKPECLLNLMCSVCADASIDN